jgi:hypothetical protein
MLVHHMRGRANAAEFEDRAIGADKPRVGCPAGGRKRRAASRFLFNGVSDEFCEGVRADARWASGSHATLASWRQSDGGPNSPAYKPARADWPSAARAPLRRSVQPLCFRGVTRFECELLFEFPNPCPEIIRHALSQPVEAALGRFPGTRHRKGHPYVPIGC